MRHYLKIIIPSVVMIILLVTGCRFSAASPKPFVVISTNPSNSSTETPFPTITVIQTSRAVITPTPTNKPKLTDTIPSVAIPTPTFTITSTQLPTVAPTLTKAEREAKILKVLENGGNCRLPCWWGITPGKTTWQEAQQNFASIGLKTTSVNQAGGVTGHGTERFDIGHLDVINSQEFYESDGVIQTIVVNSDGIYNPSLFRMVWTRFSPEQIILDNGVPSRVWVLSYKHVAEGQPGTSMPYFLWLFYDESGFLIIYRGELRYAQRYEFCPTFSGEKANLGTGLALYAHTPDNPEPLEKLSSYSIESVLPIDQAAGISVKEFYNLITQTEKPACFDTPRDIWP